MAPDNYPAVHIARIQLIVVPGVGQALDWSAEIGRDQQSDRGQVPRTPQLDAPVRQSSGQDIHGDPFLVPGVSQGGDLLLAPDEPDGHPVDGAHSQTTSLRAVADLEG